MVAALGPEDLYFTVETAEQARALAALGGRPRVQLTGTRVTELLAELPPTGLHHLWLRDSVPRFTAQDWQRAAPNLRTLRLPVSYLAGDVAIPPGVTIAAPEQHH